MATKTGTKNIKMSKAVALKVVLASFIKGDDTITYRMVASRVRMRASITFFIA